MATSGRSSPASPRHLLCTSVFVSQSPAFTYKGKKRHEPATVGLDLNMRSDLAALLGVDLLNDASYRVDLVAPGGQLINVVPTTGLVDNTTWSAIPSASVNPKLLKIGSSYRIRITTTYHSVATVIAPVRSATTTSGSPPRVAAAAASRPSRSSARSPRR